MERESPDGFPNPNTTLSSGFDSLDQNTLGQAARDLGSSPYAFVYTDYVQPAYPEAQVFLDGPSPPPQPPPPFLARPSAIPGFRDYHTDGQVQLGSSSGLPVFPPGPPEGPD